MVVYFFIFWPATGRRLRQRKKVELTATCPWACTRKPGMPRGPPSSGALRRREPMREGPLGGRGEEFLSSTTAGATDDDVDETEQSE